MVHVKRRRLEKGTAVVEAALMAPWIFFLFVGVLDFGFYAYSAIATQNAARAAAMRTSYSQFNYNNQTLACLAALNELRGLPGVYELGSTCSPPVTVSLQVLDNTTTPPCGDCAVTPTARSVVARVTYQTLPMIPIPGILTGQLTLNREAEARVLIK
jgi:Flp pilus assembly protein TadG